jgi:hypothetical protein
LVIRDLSEYRARRSATAGTRTRRLGEDVRFKNYGLAPKSAEDFAFLLHGFHYLKDDGVMSIILPHGVLFRGGAEAMIRKKLLDEHVVPFFAFAPGIRKMIYTTNAVEALHRSLRKIIKTRGSFPNDDAALKLLYLAIKNAGLRWRRGVEWTAAMGSLPLRSARVSQDRRDDPHGKANQPSNPMARVWPSSWPCKGWPSATAFGG